MDEKREKVQWYYKPWVVIVFLIFVLGPFGLPLVYKSPRFNKTWKIVLTLLMVVYTRYLVVGTIEMMRGLSTHLAQLQAVLG